MSELNLPSNLIGIDRLPEGLRGPNAIAWLSLYLSRLDALQGVLDEFLGGLLTWDQLGAQTPQLALRALGKILGQPRPDGATDDEYKLILQIRRIVRQSRGTQPDVRAVVHALGSLGGGGASVSFTAPHTVIVTFANFAAVAARGLSIAVVSSLLQDAIGDVDRLQIWDAVGNVFTWDVLGKGWAQAVWTTPLFDSET